MPVRVTLRVGDIVEIGDSVRIQITSFDRGQIKLSIVAPLSERIQRIHAPRLRPMETKQEPVAQTTELDETLALVREAERRNTTD